MSDRRLTPANARVAAVELRGEVAADTFVGGEMCRVLAPVADLRCEQGTGRLDRQLLMGAGFRVLERLDGFAFGQAVRDGYVGYVAEADLDTWLKPTHWVSVSASLGFAAADFKTPNPTHLSYGVQVSIIAQNGRFMETVNGQFVPALHLSQVNHMMVDPVTEATKLLGTPYLWGGNSSGGIDCSGLVQIAAHACGLACPGDSDLQMQSFGALLPDTATLQRGDLLFWKGHVAWVTDEQTLIHANAYHMAVAYEGIQEAIDRIEKQGDGPVIARKRLELP